MKVLFAPLNYGSVVQEGWYDAFREAGAQLEVFDYMNMSLSKRKTSVIRQELLNKALHFNPDLMFLQIQHTTIIDAGTIKNIKTRIPGCKIVNWTGDVRDHIPGTYRNIAEVSDLNLISSTGQLGLYQNGLSKPVKYLQIGFNPKLYYPEEMTRSEFDWDISFIANCNNKEKYPGKKERIDVCTLLRNKLGDRFCLYGDGWPKSLQSKGSIDQKALINVYHRSFSVLSVSHFNDIDHYFSDRLLMCMASGRPTISYRFPKYESYFTNNCDLVVANNVNEVYNKLTWLLENRDLADFIGQSGADKVMAEHTYLSRVNELFNISGLK